MIKIVQILVAMLLLTVLAPQVHSVELQGKIVQGGLVWGQLTPGSEMILNGEPVKVGPEGHFVFGFGRDEGPTASLVIVHRDGNREERTIKIEKREFDIERVDGLPPKTVTPPPEWRERRKVETGRVREARSYFADNMHWSRGFIRPAEGRLSGFYGSQRILNGEPRSPHYGLDIAGPTGTPVHAPAGGVVRLAVPDFLLEGGIIIIDHGFGVTSTLFHLNSVDVKEGVWIHQGDLIGTIGATGRASGPHVDWRVNWKDVRLDPQLLINDSIEDKK